MFILEFKEGVDAVSSDSPLFVKASTHKKDFFPVSLFKEVNPPNEDAYTFYRKYTELDKVDSGKPISLGENEFLYVSSDDFFALEAKSKKDMEFIQNIIGKNTVKNLGTFLGDGLFGKIEDHYKFPSEDPVRSYLDSEKESD